MWTDPAYRSLPPLITRRQMLQRMCAGFGLLGLATVAGSRTALAASGASGASAFAPRLPHFAPRAKRLVFLFLNGGPSHIDTFDPKPALAKYEGQLPPGNSTNKAKAPASCPRRLRFPSTARADSR